MGIIYDNWERLVRAVLRREQFLISAHRAFSDHSIESSSSSSFSAPFEQVENVISEQRLVGYHLPQVHQLMCDELFRFVYGVSNIFPEIEAARPRCSSGIQALCLLNNAIVKAELLLQYCSEASKLYLALTGDAILSRCQKSRNLLEKSLSQLQNMVPVLLVSEISQVISDLRTVSFRLDPSEEEASKVLRYLLRHYGSTRDSIEETAFEAIRVATLRLGITSQEALLREKRSIKKLVDQVGENDPAKRKILLFFLHLLNKYGKMIIKEQYVTSLQREEPFPSSLEVESRLSIGPDDAQINMFSISAVPEEFRCPLSLRLMYDPVVIATGQTFERMWIQKWFDEGHDTCPKTQKKLPHLSLTPNTAVEDLITKWCTANKVSNCDPTLPEVFQRLETLSCFASLSNWMNDLSLPIDFSNLSIGSSDARQGSDSSYPRIHNGLDMTSTDTDDIYRFQSNSNTCEADMKILLELDSLPWELRREVVQDIKISENHEHQNCNSMSCRTLVRTSLNFLKDSHDLCDVKAQKTGCLLLSSFLSNCRSSIAYLEEEEVYRLLALFLDTEVVEEALGVLEVLSCHELFNYNFFETSGALVCTLRILDKEIGGRRELALRILYNLSANSSMRSFVLASGFLSKLISFLEDTALAGYSIVLLENFCCNEDARIIIAETDGCIASITKLFERGRDDEQEHAVAVLLSLCSQRVQYCQLVMDEGIIPFLVAVSNGGNYKGKVMAKELLRLLRYVDEDTEEFSETDIENSRNSGNHSTQRKIYRKATGIFKKLSVFTKHGFVAAKTKS